MITREKIAALHKDLDAVLQKFAVDNDLVVGKFRIVYDANSFTCQKIQFSTKDSNPNELDPRYLSDLKRNGALYGLNSSMIGEKLVLPSKRGQAPEFEFVGMRASKAVCRNVGDGKPYLWDAKFIAHQLSKISK